MPIPPDDEPDDEPDARFTLANERTFLAWARTALALLVAGVALAEVASLPDVAGGGHLLGAALAAAGMVVASTSHRRWRAVDHAIRTGTPIPPSPLPRRLGPFLAVMAAAAVVVIAVGAVRG